MKPKNGASSQKVLHMEDFNLSQEETGFLFAVKKKTLVLTRLAYYHRSICYAYITRPPLEHHSPMNMEAGDYDL